MIHVDDRIGSKHLRKPLALRGLPVDLVRLDFADVAFDGSGRACGIELKKLDDLIGSLSTKRFQVHQLPGMMRSYQVRFLIIEGLYREASDGMIEKGVLWGHRMNWMRQRSLFTYARLRGTLYTLMFKCGFYIINTRDETHTANEVAALYSWWQDYDKHQSHIEGVKANTFTTEMLGDPWFNRDRHFPEAVALQVPGLGKKRALAAAKHFRSVQRMSWATARQWEQVEGVGAILAKKSHAIFRKEI